MIHGRLSSGGELCSKPGTAPVILAEAARVLIVILGAEKV